MVHRNVQPNHWQIEYGRVHFWRQRNFTSFHFFHTELASKGYHISDLRAVESHQWNAKLVTLGRGSGGDKVLWAAQRSKAQLTETKTQQKANTHPPTPPNPIPQPPALESFANKCWYQSSPGLARLIGDWAGMLWVSDQGGSWTRKMEFFSSWSRISRQVRGIELPRTLQKPIWIFVP